MQKIKPLPLELIDEYLELDFSIPVRCLVWKKSPCYRIKAGSPAGYITDDGNGNPISRVRLKGKIYLSHRIVFYLVHNYDPGSAFTVDHKNFDYVHNKELRKATKIQQAQYRRKRKGCYTSKFKGVRWRKDCQKWAAQINVNKQKINLGLYQEEIAAAKAYNSAAKEFFGDFAFLNEL